VAEYVTVNNESHVYEIKEQTLIKNSKHDTKFDSVKFACSIYNLKCSGFNFFIIFHMNSILQPNYYKDAPHFRLIGAGPQYRLEIPYAKLDFTGTYSIIARNCHGEAKAIISLQIYAKGKFRDINKICFTLYKFISTIFFRTRQRGTNAEISSWVSLRQLNDVYTFLFTSFH